MGQAKMLCQMTRVAKLLGVSGSTLQGVHDTLIAEGMSEYDFYLTCKGAAMIYPHVAEVLREECQGAATIPAAR